MRLIEEKKPLSIANRPKQSVLVTPKILGGVHYRTPTKHAMPQTMANVLPKIRAPTSSELGGEELVEYNTSTS
jgi:hypothetical protein